MKAKKQITKVSILAMLSAVSIVLYYLEFPILPSAGHLKLDFSDIPALFAAILYGPVSGVIVEFIKNLIEFISKGVGTQMGFGNIMNFLVAVAYIVPFSVVLRKLTIKAYSKNKALIISSVVGTVCILFVGIAANYIIAPWFFKVFLSQEVGTNMLWAAIYSATILNVIKGIMLSIVSFPIVKVLLQKFKKISF